ncbi:TPA: hypothetical protein U0U96_002029 [Listeria monocytogenes]|nr:hypothetical protein [Listeria innocua]EEJ1215716.1 hypothetical protein [Listeria innocua]HEM0865343.1 hypothetical protein [Listeria monocytogenes]
MCELCNTDVNVRATLISDENDELRITKENMLDVAVDWEHGLRYGEFIINYCPRCGRKLEL